MEGAAFADAAVAQVVRADGAVTAAAQPCVHVGDADERWLRDVLFVYHVGSAWSLRHGGGGSCTSSPDLTTDQPAAAYLLR